jgi:hypothetical protein
MSAMGGKETLGAARQQLQPIFATSLLALMSSVKKAVMAWAAN